MAVWNARPVVMGTALRAKVPPVKRSAVGMYEMGALTALTPPAMSTSPLVSVTAVWNARPAVISPGAWVNALAVALYTSPESSEKLALPTPPVMSTSPLARRAAACA